VDKKIALGIIPILAIALASLSTASYQVTVTVSVAPTLEVTPNYNAVDFGTLTVGTSDNPAPHQTDGIYNYTISTNACYRLSVYGDDFSAQFPISNLKFQAVPNNAQGVTIDNPNQPPMTLSTTSKEYNVTFYPQDSVLYHGYYLTVPKNTPQGSYSTTVYIDIYNV